MSGLCRSKLGGKTRREVVGKHGKGGRLGKGGYEVHGFPAQKDTQAMHRGQDGVFQKRNSRFGNGDLSLRPRQFELAYQACLEARFSDGGIGSPRFKVVQRNFHAQLLSPQLHVIPRHLTLKGHKGVAKRLFGCTKVRLRRFDLPPHAAEDIDLPGSIESDLVQVSSLLRQARRHAARLARLGGFRAVVSFVGSLGAALRQQLGSADPRQRARLLHPRPGDAKVKVALHRILNQTVQNRILEHLPPGH